MTTHDAERIAGARVQAVARNWWNSDRRFLGKSWPMPAWSRTPAWRRRPYVLGARRILAKDPA